MDQNKKREKILQEYNEAMLTYEAKLLALEEEEEAEKLFEEFDAMPDPEYSEEFKLRMDEIISEADGKQKNAKKGKILSFSKRFISSAACFLGMFIIGGALLTVSSEAYLEHLKYLMTKTFSTHTLYIEENAIPARFKEQLIKNGWESILYPAYLPSGYKLVEINSTKLKCRMVFGNGNKTFAIEVKTTGANAGYGLDTISSNITKVDINGIEATYVIKEQDKSLIFLTNEKIVLLNSKLLSRLQIIDIAESMQQISIIS